MVLKGEKIQYSVHLVMPETHKVLKLWLKYIYKADKWNTEISVSKKIYYNSYTSMLC